MFSILLCFFGVYVAYYKDICELFAMILVLFDGVYLNCDPISIWRKYTYL